jgi:hypothetical protein
VCGNELSQCSNGVLLDLASGDNCIWIWGVSSFTSESECGGKWFLFFVVDSVDGAPPASISPFFVKDSESVFDMCWSGDPVLSFDLFCYSPL